MFQRLLLLTMLLLCCLRNNRHGRRRNGCGFWTQCTNDEMTHLFRIECSARRYTAGSVRTLDISIMRALLTREGIGKPLRGGHEAPRFLDETAVCIFEANCASVKLDRIKPIFMFLEKLADVFASPAFAVTWPFKGDLDDPQQSPRDAKTVQTAAPTSSLVGRACS